MKSNNKLILTCFFIGLTGLSHASSKDAKKYEQMIKEQKYSLYENMQRQYQYEQKALEESKVSVAKTQQNKNNNNNKNTGKNNNSGNSINYLPDNSHVAIPPTGVEMPAIKPSDFNYSDVSLSNLNHTPNLNDGINSLNKINTFLVKTKNSAINHNQVAENKGSYKVINCWNEAGKKYNVDPWLLFAYAETESSLNPNAINAANRNRSVDRGLMQINSFWETKLNNYGITQDHLFDSCISIFIGAWIIRDNIDRYGYNYNGLVAYNVGNPFDKNKKSAGEKYYKKLMSNYNKLKSKYSN